MSNTDPVALSADLIRCASVTPEEGGALTLLETRLAAAGFDCVRADRNGIANLFARWGPKGHPRSFGFNGHTDVVPVGDLAEWSVPPFAAVECDGVLYGRGACDMKSGVAAFAAAAMDFVRDTPPKGAIILAITGDEEGDAQDGTLALLDHMAKAGEAMSVCLVGEPTCRERVGDMIKIGRRGSLNAWLTVTGSQGHVAYPQRARNPLSALVRLLDRLAHHELDQGTDYFDASTLAITTIDTGNPATNVIPAQCRATVNIRFNDSHSGDSLSLWLRDQADMIAQKFGVEITTEIKVSGESFLTPPGPLPDLIKGAIKTETGITPELSTSGGTSDARFVKNHCPVVEVGLVGKTMHQVDEHVEIDQIHQLKALYTRILRDYFA
ncbi:succinyl-diaminopimelate desuccinylase [Pontibaca salina]|uniref:Succinyl-diaminopimelate desuccinylase n=1 Tax=Pontibaca salina TaxID=2795731 RepID=A0A934HM94_9RHOB|nr:succinyl-diaminopimelate desuccinylase [Pontibaca salina]MBI6630693.1 succinyl-diaminopimelate desuccinylase [Pontibaca salina]